MNTKNTKTESRDRRRNRIRAKVFGTALKPRLSVFKSNKYISAQLIDDDKGVTLASATTKGLKGKGELIKSKEVGLALGKVALANKISSVVFDRGGYIYTGSVQAVAEGAREAGLKF
jgi:large subunit ribosomal protein L18